MHKHNIEMDEQLLISFFTHQCTTDELIAVEQWISLDKKNAKLLFEMERVWSLKDEFRFSNPKTVESAFKRFLDSVDKPIEMKKVPFRKKRIFMHWITYAAAVVCVVILTLAVADLTDRTPVLTNVVEVPRGQRVSVTLSDGTVVWLNSDSRFTYPSQFTGNERGVTLEGEGYFEVTKSKGSSFVVHNNGLNVRVLGTKFNVKAYKDEKTSVYLKEGKVEVYTMDNKHRLTLRPQDKVSYSDREGFSLEKNVSKDESDSWRNGELIFLEQPLINILRTLERKFDVSIVLNNKKLGEESFTCRVKKDATLVQVLNLLKDTREFDYKIENRRVLIFNK